MAAIADIQSWVDMNRKVYKVTVDRFLNTPAYKEFGLAGSMPSVPTTPQLLKTWRSRAGVISDKKYGIDNLSDRLVKQLLPRLAISEDLFNKVASETKASVSEVRLKEYVQTGLDLVESAYLIRQAAKDHTSSSYRQESVFQHAEMIALGGFLMVFMAFQPYHLYVGFAYNSFYEDKKNSPEEQIAEHYDYFTDPQWVTISKYVGKTLMDKSFGDDINSLVTRFFPNTKSITSADVSSLVNTLNNSNLTNHKTMARTLGASLNRMLLDTYMRD